METRPIDKRLTEELSEARAEAADFLEARVLNAVYVGVGIVFFAVAIWQQVNPDGPRELVERARESLAERRRYREAMLRTFEQIDELPTIDDFLEGDR